MIRTLRRALGDLWWIERNIRLRIRLSRWLFYRVPFVGRGLSAIVDRSMLKTYALDVFSPSVDVKALALAHPIGVLIGGNGLVSPGRVSLMAGVKLVARSPEDPEFLARHATRDVFRFGDNVIIGANSVVVGPVEICDNVVVAAMSLVNKSIAEPGVYGGIPARKLKDEVTDVWVSHLRTLV